MTSWLFVDEQPLKNLAHVIPAKAGIQLWYVIALFTDLNLQNFFDFVGILTRGERD